MPAAAARRAGGAPAAGAAPRGRGRRSQQFGEVCGFGVADLMVASNVVRPACR